MLKLIECPRDGMQGLKNFIPTREKAAYINMLLKVGYHTIDFGSFVSPRAIPQLSDTKQVVKLLDLSQSQTKLLGIIGNPRGALEALEFPEVSYIGFPFSISDTFLKLNIKSSYRQALNDLKAIQELVLAKNRELVVYISMAFGNPYGDVHSLELILEAMQELKSIGVPIVNLADTVGVGSPEQIGKVFREVISEFPDMEIGFHLHTSPESYFEKIDEAYKNNCRRFDSVMGGLGGCPMAAQTLLGNLSTENLLKYFTHEKIALPIDIEQYGLAQERANRLFP